MDENLFSSNYKLIRESTLSKKIQQDLKLLRKHFSDEKVIVYEGLIKESIFICFPVKISIPTRGVVNNINIHETEPVFLVLHKELYPFEAPLAFSDRKDFPCEDLPHLNPYPPGFPASFCLHRGNINDWFAEHGIIDFVERIRAWLEDAVANKLIRKNDEFEFTRINDAIGYTIFDEKRVIDFLKSKLTKSILNKGFIFTLQEINFGSEFDPIIKKNKIFFRLIHPVNEDEIADSIKNIYSRNQLAEENKFIPKQVLGIFAYSVKDIVNQKYFGQIPNRISDFLNWTDSLNIPLREAVGKYLSEKMHLIASIPFSIIIKRPQKVIRHLSEYEILNFVIYAGEDFNPLNQELNPDSPVYTLDHRNPLTFNLAIELSSLNISTYKEKVLVIGCGALGSKISMHLVRSGQNNITFVDNDELSPHNLIRHALLGLNLGKNKAEQMKAESDWLYMEDPSKNFIAVPDSILKAINEKKVDLNKFDLIIDTSVSNSVFNLLTENDLKPKNVLCHSELAYNGKYGNLFIEGLNRNPRIDDLQIYLFNLSINREDISIWLRKDLDERSEITSANEEIMVGMSCNSDTIKLSDEIISFHASVASNGIRINNSSKNKHGIIQLSKIDENSIYPFSVERMEVLPIKIIKFENHVQWQIRLFDGMEEKIQVLFKADLPNETGGLLVGHVNLKRKIVYITDITSAPPDSKKSPYLFVRGKQDVSEMIKGIRFKSGGLIDFVGEWHTHPNGGAKLSETDIQAINELRKFLDPIPYPTIILIYNNKKIHPYIYGPKHILNI